MFASLNHLLEATGQRLNTACLVDEVARTALEGESLVLGLGMARQEDKRHMVTRLLERGPVTAIVIVPALHLTHGAARISAFAWPDLRLHPHCCA